MIYSYPIESKRAAVKVERIDARKHVYRVIEGSICAIKKNTIVRELPENYRILDTNGEEIHPTGRFLITAETIDPYHLITDIF